VNQVEIEEGFLASLGMTGSEQSDELTTTHSGSPNPGQRHVGRVRRGNLGLRGEPRSDLWNEGAGWWDSVFIEWGEERWLAGPTRPMLDSKTE